MNPEQLLYAGKAKSLYRTEDNNYLIMSYRDDASAFNGEKLSQLANKGKVNNYFNAHIMQLLQAQGIPTHFEKIISDTESLVKALTMVPVECVVRNVTAGGICKRLGIAEGIELATPIFEFFYKDDKLGDPMINEYHIYALGWASKSVIETMKALTFQVNEILKPVFQAADIVLVDYKLEFGLHDGQLFLGDEFSPDGCRLWDSYTQERLDKDRFRQELGHVVEAYQEVAKRLKIHIP
ncbi:MAG: phosphoribosylaminoimidazolesuccinocarboxamide synthase [Legionellales bacterium]|nr:phosphoribosylaminoimidazolesuccinocarboxamide synthase [Legionellales bacterium]